ncbi:MAG: hypothetical protein ACFFDI_11405 [Promethearchaeota archaeon]
MSCVVQNTQETKTDNFLGQEQRLGCLAQDMAKSNSSLPKCTQESNCIMRPLLLYVGVAPRKRIVDDLVLECAEAATYLTYRDSKAVIDNLTWAEVSRAGYMIAFGRWAFS